MSHRSSAEFRADGVQDLPEVVQTELDLDKLEATYAGICTAHELRNAVSDSVLGWVYLSAELSEEERRYELLQIIETVEKDIGFEVGCVTLDLDAVNEHRFGLGSKV